MIPIVIRTALRNLWSLLIFRHTVMVCLSLWAVYIQIEYRVPGRFLFILLPWIGIALSALSFVLLFNHFVRWIPANDSLRETLSRIESWASLLILLFAVYSALLFANGNLDPSPPVDHKSEVLDIRGGEIDLGVRIPLLWAELRSWENSQRTERLLLRGDEEDRLWPGQSIVVQMRQGYFSIPWVFKLERDQEKHFREILKYVPTASEAWKNLINFYLDHQRWKEANAAIHDYLKIYPDDYDFALSVAAAFGQARHHSELIGILEPFLTRRPTYDAYNVVGFAFHKLGNNARAVELIKASIPLDPDNFGAYYHLGYVYSSMGRLPEAASMFEKVLERLPNYAEIKEQLAILRKRIADQESRRHSK